MDKCCRHISWWLWTGAGLIFIMLILGGITRLTGSGLSMSDWNLIMGAVPPVNEAEWLRVFEQYKQFPEYQQVNAGMTLQEFKSIFFWEYLHRMTGRLMGGAFLAPFIFFWIRGYFTPQLLKRAFILLGIGSLQGAMGWIMVQSGLVDVPHVSHYRLTMHLVLAFALMGLCIWFALDLDMGRKKLGRENVNMLIWSVGLVLVLQVIWGAFVAGLKAGYIYNTFPLMNGSWTPDYAWSLRPFLLNLTEHPGTVQWIHRILGTLLSLLVILLWIRTTFIQTPRPIKRSVYVLLILALAQYTLGVLTLLYHVPVVLGVVHQAAAVLLWASWLVLCHHSVYPQKNVE